MKNTDSIEQELLKIPILKWVVRFLKKIKFLGFGGMSLYDVIEMYFLGIVKGALTSRAGGIAFSFFMALFPFFLFILTLIPYVPIENFQSDFIFMIDQMLPPNTADWIHEVIRDIAENRYGGLLSFSFITSIFLMTNGVNAILSGFEYSYHIEEMRSIIKQYLVALGIGILLSVILILTVALIIYFEIAISRLKAQGWLDDDIFWIEKGRLLFFIILIFVSTSLLYKFGTKEVKFDFFFSPGALLTTILTILMFKLFAIYVEEFSNYNQLYGSIGTMLILMLFVWLNSIILLLGFELNASLSRLKREFEDKKNNV